MNGASTLNGAGGSDFYRDQLLRCDLDGDGGSNGLHLHQMIGLSEQVIVTIHLH